MWLLLAALVLLGPALYLTAILRGVQVRRLPAALNLARPGRQTVAGPSLSHYRAVALGLGGGAAYTGVPAALAALLVGGPGAVLWMLVGAGCALSLLYAEALLGAHYREPDAAGELAGGPMYFTAAGVGGRFGRLVAGVFAGATGATALAVATLGGHYTASTLSKNLPVPPILGGLLLAAVCGVALRRGVGTITRMLGIIVPFVLAGWAVWAAGRVATAWPGVGDAALEILRGAVDPDAILPGLCAGALATMAGTGIAGISAAAGPTRTAPDPALAAMAQGLVGTILVGGVTGLLLVAGQPSGGVTPFAGGGLEQASAVVVGLVSLSLILAWSYFGDRAALYLLPGRATATFRLSLLLAVLAGAAAMPAGLAGSIEQVWRLGAVALGIMVLASLTGVMLLSGVVARETGRALRREPLD